MKNVLNAIDNAAHESTFCHCFSWLLTFLVTATYAVTMVCAQSDASETTNNKHQSITYLINPPLVELFTSQGCANCPAAEITLNKLVHEKNALALSAHVDYWDYSGWEDPLAIAGNAERQMQYKKHLDVPYIFTPQFVLNGQLVMNNTAPFELYMALDLLAQQMDKIDFSVVHIDSREVIKIQAKTLAHQAVMSMVFFRNTVQTIPDSGHNEGRTLTNSHAISGWQFLGNWNGEALALPLPCEEHFGCALIISDAQSMKVLGTFARFNDSK